MLGGHAMTAITAVTAQTTLDVWSIHDIPVDMVTNQIEAALSDIGVDAIKIGMLGSAKIAKAVGDIISNTNPQGHKPIPVVFDPVMVATSGANLADAETIKAFERLMWMATLTTPNLPELDALGGPRALVGPTLIKGGHAEGSTIVDRLVDAGEEIRRWEDIRIETTSTHGTGCTLSTAIAVCLGQGMELIPAITRARQFVRAALHAAPGLGMGHGPIGHQAVDVKKL
jgi:hydroxymethylpyrimidine/phosphomethylpyrimidine kinase